MLKTAIANALWGALAIISKRARDYAFCPERARRLRARHRALWWSYQEKAHTTQTETDDMIATFWGILFGFPTVNTTQDKN